MNAIMSDLDARLREVHAHKDLSISGEDDTTEAWRLLQGVMRPLVQCPRAAGCA
jgi:hypothetical protein